MSLMIGKGGMGSDGNETDVLSTYFIFYGFK